MGHLSKAQSHLAQLSLCAACLFGVADRGQAQVIHTATADYLKPYASVLLDVMRGAGFTPEVDYYPAERAIRMLSGGGIDLDFALVPDTVEDFKSEVRLIGPVGCSEVVAFVDKKLPIRVKSAADLKGHTVVAVLGNKQPLRYLDDAGISYSTVATQESAYRLLENDRADVVIDVNLSGLRTIKALQANDRLRVEGPVLASRPAYLILRHHLEDWGPRLQSAYEAAQKSGKLQTLISSVNVSLGLPPGLATSCLKDGNFLKH